LGEGAIANNVNPLLVGGGPDGASGHGHQLTTSQLVGGYRAPAARGRGTRGAGAGATATHATALASPMSGRTGAGLTGRPGDASFRTGGRAPVVFEPTPSAATTPGAGGGGRDAGAKGVPGRV